jgi:hypothetical protein
VGAQDVGSGENGGHVGGRGGVDASVGGDWVQGSGQSGALRQRMAQEALAGGSDEDGLVELLELVEAGEEWVVFVESFAEAEARVEDDFVARGACSDGGFEAVRELGEDKRENFLRRKRRQGWPLPGAASGVHQDDAAAQRGACGGHALVPKMTADIVDDLGSGFDPELCGAGVEGVDGEDGLGSLFEDGFDDGEDAGLLLVGGERGRVGASGFATNVEDLCAFIEHSHGLGQCSFGSILGGVEVAAVGEGVGRDIEYPHDDGALAQGKNAGAESPVEAWAGGESHEGILVLAPKRKDEEMLDCADEEALWRLREVCGGCGAQCVGRGGYCIKGTPDEGFGATNCHADC